MLVSFKMLLSDECIFVVDYDFDFVVSLLLYEVLPTLGLEARVYTSVMLALIQSCSSWVARLKSFILTWMLIKSGLVYYCDSKIHQGLGVGWSLNL